MEGDTLGSDGGYSDEEEEYVQDDPVYQEDGDNREAGEGGGDDGLENHSKMVAFQAAIKAVLNRQIEKMWQEVRSTGRTVGMGKQEAEESARELHDHQKKLVLEEDGVRVVDLKLARYQKKRKNREEQNGRFRAEVESAEAEVEQRNGQNTELREELNKLSGEAIHLQTIRLEVENKVGVDQQCTDKGEQDFRQAQEAKAVQDKYIQSMGEEVEQMEGLVGQYTAQATSMDQGTGETMTNVRRAEAEIVRVKGEESRMVTNWTNTVVNVNKRDEALSNFKGAIEAKKIELKEVKAKIEGTKNDILGRQAEHEQLTGIFKRVSKLAGQNQGTIKRLQKTTMEETLELGRLGRVRGESEDALMKTETEVRALEAEEAALRLKVERADEERRGLEGEVVALLRDQVTTERSTGWAESRVKEVRGRIKELDTEAGETSNRLAQLEGELAAARSAVEEEGIRKKGLEVRAKMLVAQETEAKSGLEKTLKAIDKVQNMIDVGNKLRAKLLAATGGEETSPLEQEIKRTREELEELASYCATTKRMWTKMQNQLIKAHLEKDETQTELGQSKNKLFILQEKKITNEDDIRTLSADLAKLNKRIEHFDHNIKKLNTILAEERQKLETLEDERANKQEETFARVADIEEAIEATKEDAKRLEINRHFIVEQVREVDLEVYEWEDKVKAIKETQDHLALERARDGEMEGMKSEVHFLDQRRKDLDRMTGELVTSLEEHAVRREAIYERINAEQASELEKKREKVEKSVNVRKVVDMKNNIKKLDNQMKTTTKALEEVKQRLEELRVALEKIGDDVEVMRLEAQNMDENILESQDEREARLAGVLQMQTRAKWFEGIKNNQYRLQKREGDSATEDLKKLQSLNAEVRDLMTNLGAELRQHSLSLRRAANMLIRVQE